jgi:hypothetical protein
MPGMTGFHVMGRRVATATMTVTLIAVGLAPAAHADNTTMDYTSLRNGWDANEPSLSPGQVSSGHFGQVFNTTLQGQIYAQPLIAGNTVIVATQDDLVYGTDANTGAIQWQRSVGRPEPATATGCADVTPNYGVTATPVIDSASGTVYVVSRSWDGANVNSASYAVHALDILTGVERSGWPVPIAGSATNDATTVFDPTNINSRPGLLLLNGWVYFGFGSMCDQATWKGWVGGVSTSSGQMRLWTDEPGALSYGGIWQSGAALMSDGAGRLFVATGNGDVPPPGPGNAPPSQLGNSVVRLSQHADGSLVAADFFAPSNASTLNTLDLDVGSGGPVGLPDSFGVPGHPHLLITAGKEGRVYLLDRDNLGGEAQGPGGTDAVVAETPLLGNGVFAHAAAWPGDGGYVYLNAGMIRAFRISTDQAGNTSLLQVGATPQSDYRSASPIITSSGTTSGSALMWIIAGPLNGAPTAELRAYGTVPQATQLPLVFRAPIGTATKFSVPVANNGHVYVGSLDGHLLGFGAIPAWSLVPSQAGGTSSTLSANAMVSPSDGWSVGSYSDGTSTWPLTEHWNGSSWNIVVPPRGGVSSALTSVAAISSSNVWAAGSYVDGAGKRWPLTQHWNGTSWGNVVPPRGGSTSTFNGISATASNDIWAVGSYNDANGARPLTEHWNGSSWKVMVPPLGGTSSVLNSVKAITRTDVWAVGTYFDAAGSARPFSEHWNGTAWAVVVPQVGGVTSSLTSVAAVSSTDAWAVGSYVDGAGVTWPLTEHWNGTLWQIVVPSPGGTTSAYTAVAAISATDVWAVGWFHDSAGVTRPLSGHWDGTTWNVALPILGGINSTINGLAVTGPNNVWATGWYNSATGIALPLTERYSY